MRVCVSLNPFGSTLLQFVDFDAAGGPNVPPNRKLEFTIFNYTARKPASLLILSRKIENPLSGSAVRPSPAWRCVKIKAVLPPSHLIGRVGVWRRRPHRLLAIRVEGGLHGLVYFHSAFASRLPKGGGEHDEKEMVLLVSGETQQCWTLRQLCRSMPG